MATRKVIKPVPKFGDETFELTTSECSTVAEAGTKLTENDDDEDEAPVVFLCGKCKVPIGDSLSWAGSDDDQNQIILRCVSDSVVIGNEPFVSDSHKDLACFVVNLNCRFCCTVLGVMYASTPAKLDYKRSLFCLSVESIESYVLGSGSQQVAELDAEKWPVTMKYQENVERQLSEVKALAVAVGQRLLEIESDLQSANK
ncbi:protein Mis18-alpha [Chanos chanos]|uniref:Protein Mis18-alpha n=1 Tax=Chanos chanos TaxID=29144 RepID=A0A6J2WV10_CHACN|nr:protein Mis18-alpha [Chanos chanos]